MVGAFLATLWEDERVGGGWLLGGCRGLLMAFAHVAHPVLNHCKPVTAGHSGHDLKATIDHVNAAATWEERAVTA